MLKLAGKADGVLRTIDSRRGVEAWRSLWEEIGRKDAQSIHVEFIKLTCPKEVAKISQMQSWLNRWEVRLDELQAFDEAEMTIGPIHRMTIAINACPRN